MSIPFIDSYRLGQSIRKIRCKKVWSQETLAHKANLKVQTLRNIENGRTKKPHFQTIKKIADALGLQPEQLIHQSVEEYQETPDEIVEDTNNNQYDMNIYQPAERAFFGLKRITVAVPLRIFPGRVYPVISSEDDRARKMLISVLSDLSFNTETFDIPTDGSWHPPATDVIAICGPLNSVVTVEALSSDPFLVFNNKNESCLWTIMDKATGQCFISPMDKETKLSDYSSVELSDIAYIGRLPYRGRRILIIAGIHAIGSVGAVHFLATNLTSLYKHVETNNFSMVIKSEHNSSTVIKSEILCPPRIHQA